MDAEARIVRMEGEGLITPAQARALRDGLEAPRAAPEPPRRSPARVATVIAVGVVVACVIALVVVGGDDVAPVQNVAETLNQPEELGTMNRSIATLLAAALLLLPPIAVLAWSYNGLITREEAVLSAWAQTESNFQRRMELVPALVETVSRFLKHERETLTAVTEERGEAIERLADRVDGLAKTRARAVDATSGGGSPVDDQARLDDVSAAEAAMSREIAGFLAIAEDYPELRSADQFLELQAQLEGTENRINVSRMRFNEAVESYNGAIRRLPQSLVARLGGFKRKAYFRADEGAGRTPGVDFE